MQHVNLKMKQMNKKNTDKIERWRAFRAVGKKVVQVIDIIAPVELCMNGVEWTWSGGPVKKMGGVTERASCR